MFEDNVYPHDKEEYLSPPMHPQPDLDPEDRLGDFDALLRELDAPCDNVVVNGGYANLMARLASPDYRRRCGHERG